ncbi:hypothetical protein [Rhodalgimonas zhirmunskyi]|uniref:Uncharacterized protein n=1 Tax=Rhodalgimonas zhirmunskyi TaxID=2964767 RepID=A0AAJ1X630_9RHOB|nr:hypothetical protein [Rhodoalgimonas zhirmunskyi]MDQ2094284.1 hypothetical protein [Rhodoalgimonas zhirmunskyi]
MARKAINRILKARCRRKLLGALPEIEDELRAYAKGSDTTGTQWITLWFAVDGILKHKPRLILESGTGASTIVLASAVQKLRSEDPSYDGRIVSMESVEEWYLIARDNLPETYADTVEIIHGPRKIYNWALFRGYIHDNIPDLPFDFFFLDGPAFQDEFGSTFCADVLFVAEDSPHDILRGVIDGRASSAFVLQTLLGTRAARFFLSNMAGRFAFAPARLRRDFKTTEFRADIRGRLRLKRFKKHKK